MLLRVVGSCCPKFETGQTFIYVQTDLVVVASVCTKRNTQCVFYAVIFNTLKSCQRNSCGSVCLLGAVKVDFSTKGCNIIILPWLCQLID